MRLIDADELRAFFADGTEGYDFVNINRCDVIDAIDNAPTVEPTFGLFKEMLCEECGKRPHGEWVEERCIDIRYKIAKCSHCGKWSRLASHDTGYSVKYEYYPFCHWCGADMRVKDELGGRE